MSSTDAVTDSTDWLNTPLASLAPIENSLRCQVCKDFFTTPMITSCSHTFCSLCIRRYLSQEGRCPACRESDQEVKLRRNWIVEELVAQFQAGREGILKYAKAASNSNGEPPSKRRKLEHTTTSERRSTRIQSRRNDQINGDNHKTTVEIQDSDEGSEYEDEPEVQPIPKEDGLIACPICNKRMKEAQINRHLDSNCQDIPSSPRRSDTPQKKPQPDLPGREKLPTLNYSMFSEAALRKKLKELGIANFGSKELMRRRHIEWVNLWNASCDAKTPVSVSQLRRDLDQWERTLGRQIDRGPSGVMVKDFDRDSWQKSNKGDFDDLIRLARERARKQKDAANSEPVNGGEHDVSEKNEPLEAPNHVSARDMFGQRSDENLYSTTEPVVRIIPESPVKGSQTNGVNDHNHDAQVDDENVQMI